MKRILILPVLIAVCVTGCGGDIEARSANTSLRSPAGGHAVAGSKRVCEVSFAGRALPDQVRETSGLARSVRNPDLFWTHNDAGNEPELFAIDATGGLVQSVHVTGADLIDWEDIEPAPCGEDTCLLVADIGDNDGDREWITIYRVSEPDEDARTTAPAEALHARFPDGSKDAEALFADRAGNLYVIAKGRAEEIALYRYPAPQQAGYAATLQRVRQLFPRPEHDGDRVTAASTTPDGRWVGVRTYRTLYIYAADALIGDSRAEPLVFDLTPLAEPQGESLVIAHDGTVWLTSEAASGDAPLWAQLRCDLPED